MAMSPEQLTKLESALAEQLDLLDDDAASRIEGYVDAALARRGPRTTTIADVLQARDADADPDTLILTRPDVISLAIVDAVWSARSGEEEVARAARDAAVRTLGGVLRQRFGGPTIELRVPPLTAVQLTGPSAGPRHTRGTPPNVAETDPDTFLALAFGELTWATARAEHRVQASGSSVDDLARMVPVARRWT